MENCELCSFNNPKCSVTAIIIRNGTVLMLKRNEEPFKGMWDLPGGYMQAEESPLMAIKREVKEELGLDCNPTPIDQFTGYGHWKEATFPVMNFAFLVVVGDDQKITLNNENSDYCWQNVSFIEPEKIAFDSNQKMAKWVKFNLDFDLKRVRELVTQLDSSAVVSEESLYKAVLDGHIVRKYDGEKLIGMGWIFPRQTMLRHQAVVDDMIVDNEYRGKGIGKAILLELLIWARKQGVEVVELTTNPKREAANALYQKVGFVIHPTNHYLLKIDNMMVL